MVLKDLFLSVNLDIVPFCPSILTGLVYQFTHLNSLVWCDVVDFHWSVLANPQS